MINRSIVLVIEDSESAAKSIVSYFQKKNRKVVHLSKVDVIDGSEIKGFSFMEDSVEVMVDCRQVAEAYVDYYILGLYYGDDVVSVLVNSGVPKIVGISSSNSGNYRMKNAGAHEAVRKPFFLIDLLNDS